MQRQVKGGVGKEQEVARGVRGRGVVPRTPFRESTLTRGTGWSGWSTSASTSCLMRLGLDTTPGLRLSCARGRGPGQDVPRQIRPKSRS